MHSENALKPTRSPARASKIIMLTPFFPRNDQHGDCLVDDDLLSVSIAETKPLTGPPGDEPLDCAQFRLVKRAGAVPLGRPSA